MESLALAAIIVVLGTLLGALVSAIVVRRPPTSPLARAALAPFAMVALLSGGRLAFLPIGEPVRAVGALASLLGAGALCRLAKGKAPGA